MNNDNKDLVSKSAAYAIFFVLGILIAAAFAFAGWNIWRYSPNPVVIAMGKDFRVSDVVEEELEEYFEDDEISIVAPTITLRPRPEPTPEPEPEPEPTPAPPTPQRAPAPTPEPPETISCHACNASGIMTCPSCNGVAGGRGTPLDPNISYDVSPVADIWWCTACDGSGVVTCGTCGGSGEITVSE
ncbi:MAG: hypothetical protein FWF81_02530 [Defluviitaleaceae bacterium]|nr:hypothetical protein [Defluviitaleaceae bacterium]